MTGFLAPELRCCLRDVRHLVIAVAMPIGLYLLFTGLFGSRSAMPRLMQNIAQFLLSNAVTGLGWRIGGGQASALKAVLLLIAWTLASGLVALLAYRRHATRPGR